MAAMSVFGSIQFFGVGDAQIHRLDMTLGEGSACSLPHTEKSLKSSSKKSGNFKSGSAKSCFQHVI
jgi:hypothetical protein